MKLIVLAAAALAGAPPSAGQSPPDPSTPHGAAVAFYDAYLQSTAGSFPSARTRSRLRRQLSPGLNALLGQAEEAEANHRWRTHGREPPLIGGDVFTSLYEGAGEARVGPCRAYAMRATCRVRLGAGPTRWEDQLVLVSAPRGWVIDDVVYGGSWRFANKGRLTLLLREAIAGR